MTTPFDQEKARQKSIDYEFYCVINQLVATGKWIAVREKILLLLETMDKESEGIGIDDKSPVNDFRFHKGKKMFAKKMLDWPGKATTFLNKEDIDNDENLVREQYHNA